VCSGAASCWLLAARRLRSWYLVLGNWPRPETRGKARRRGRLYPATKERRRGRLRSTIHHRQEFLCPCRPKSRLHGARAVPHKFVKPYQLGTRDAGWPLTEQNRDKRRNDCRCEGMRRKDGTRSKLSGIASRNPDHKPHDAEQLWQLFTHAGKLRTGAPREPASR
jgi:hypothetical protein